LAQQKAELEASRLAAAKAAEAADVGGHRAWIFSGEQPKITGIGGCSSIFITFHHPNSGISMCFIPSMTLEWSMLYHFIT
jgi:hypothetical protein